MYNLLLRSRDAPKLHQAVNSLRENVCYKCVPKAGEDREIREEDLPKTEPAIYVCESSRTILERSREHWSSYRSGDKDSHMWRHQDLVHKGEPAEFKMRAVGNHRTALGRQIAEAVRIRRIGEQDVF